MQLPVAQKNRNGAIRRVVISIRTVLRENCAIEQFRNPQMAQLQTKQNYTDVMHNFTGLVRFLIRHGRLVDSDPEIMATQLCLPISMWLGLCDREPERENDVMKLIERHIRQFFEVYQTK